MGVAVMFDDDNATVEAVPGARASCGISVENTGMVVDSVLLDLVGDAAEWATVEPDRLNLLPGASAQARIAFSPPRVATLAPGDVPFGVRAMSTEDPDGSRIEEGVVRVGEFSDLGASLVPKSATGRRSARYRLVVENRGNRPEALVVEPADPDVKLGFRTRPQRFTAAPGTATFVRLTATPRKTFFKGPNQTLPFQVSASPEQGRAVTADGVMLEKQTLPEWLLPLLGGAILLAGLLFALWLTVLRPVVHSAATAASAAKDAAGSAKSAAGAAKSAAGSAKSAANSAKSASSGSAGKPAALDVTLPQPTILAHTTELASATGTSASSGGAAPPLVWASSNPKIAKVSRTGVVTAISAGSVTISATTATSASSKPAAKASTPFLPHSSRHPAGPGSVGATVTPPSAGPAAGGTSVLSGSAKLNVVAPVAVSTATLHAAPLGKAYSVSLNASGGTGAFTWSISAGALPGGLSLSPSTGMITGTPAALGTSRLTVHVADAGPPAQFAVKTLTLRVVNALAVSTSSLPGGMVGTHYAWTLAAAGGGRPYAWSIVPGSGSLPAGLTLDRKTGTIAGTPSTPGLASFVVRVSGAGQSVTQPLSVKVATTLTLATLKLPGAIRNAAYSQSLSAIGGTEPYRWSVTSGSPPAGMALNAASGTLSGTPTATGPSRFTVKITDSSQPSLSASHTFTVTVVKKFVATTSSLAQAPAGKPYAASLTAAGGTGPYVWTLEGTLPPGLKMSPRGAITGSPAAAGVFPFTAEAVDSSSPPQSVTVSLSITVTSSLKITTSLPDAALGVAYSQTLSAAGGTPPYTWSVTAGSLPPGLGLSATTGTVSGTPLELGTSSFTITVSDSGIPVPATSSFSTTITVTEPPGFSEPEFPTAETGRVYDAVTPTHVTGGSGRYRWSITDGTLPAGLSLATATGTISGEPSGSPGTFSFTITAADAKDPSLRSSQPETITVVAGLQVPQGFATATVDDPSFSQGAGAAVGGVPPYTYSYTSDNDETAGLSMNPVTGVLSGTADAPCPSPAESASETQVTISCGTLTYQDTMKVTDAAGYSSRVPVFITVEIPPLVFSPAPAGGQVADSSFYSLATFGDVTGGYPAQSVGESTVGGYSFSTARVSGTAPDNNGLPCDPGGCSGAFGSELTVDSGGVISGTLTGLIAVGPAAMSWTFDVNFADTDPLDPGNSIKYSLPLTIVAGAGSSN